MTVTERQQLRDRLQDKGLSRKQADIITMHMKEHGLETITEKELLALPQVGPRLVQKVKKTEIFCNG